MKTIVYVDGYNFYYGRLKHSSFKWLDLASFFSQQILSQKSPDAQLLAVKYFTAEIKTNFASRKEKAGHAQQQYHRALRANGLVSIVNGFYTAEQARAIQYRSPPDKSSRIDIWKLEEKQTDVQMALELYRDAIFKRCEQLVVCSNDSDIEPALQAVRNDCPTLKIGLVVPRPDPRHSKSRPGNARLSNLADWVFPHVSEAALKRSQFPDVVPGKRGKATKPDYW